MLKVLSKCIREYKQASLKAPLMVSLEVVMECIIPFVIAKLVNQMKAGAGFGEIAMYGLVLVVMATLSLIFGIAAGNACATASCGFAKNVRKDLFYKIQDFSFENIDCFSSSSLVTRLTTDVTNVQMAYMMIVRIAIRAPLMLVFAFVMAFIMGGRMACIFIIVVPILGIGLFSIIRLVMPLFRAVFNKYDALNNSVQENIKGIRVVKSYVREEYEKEKFDRAAEDVCGDFTRAEKILAFNNPLMQFCLYTVTIFVLSFGSYTIITSRGLDLDVGQFSALLTYSFQILSSLMMLSMVFVMITLASESAKRIVEVLEEKSSLVNPENPVYEVKDGSVDFENVSFKYSKSLTAFQGIISQITNFSTILIGMVLINNKILSLGSLIVFINISNLLIQAVLETVNVQVDVENQMISYKRFIAILNINNDDEKINNNDIGKIKQISLKDYSLGYGLKSLLINSNADFKIENNNIIVGKSGSGKSSLAKSIIGLNESYLGNIYFNNINIKYLNGHYIREKVVYLSNDIPMVKGTIINFLTDGKNVMSNKVLTVCHDLNILDFIMSLPNQFNYEIQKDGSNLSLGQKQRLSIAYGILKNPDVIIFDETFSNIDDANKNKILENLDKYNILKIYITHQKLNVTNKKKFEIKKHSILQQE